MTSKSKPLYKRILLKISGEALVGSGHEALDAHVLDRIVSEVVEVHKLGVQVGVVIGGGNFFRGVTLSKAGISRISADHMGMLGTLMNAIAMRDSFERMGVEARVHSAIPMSGMVDHFNYRKAIHNLNESRVVIFAAGTGNPFVTTDTAASLRAIETECEVVLKATQVDGIYDKDPRTHKDAKRYKKLTYQEALAKELAIMDLSAFCQCRDYNLELRVFNIHKQGSLFRVVTGEDEGTLVTN